jgi:hypothetical protein
LGCDSTCFVYNNNKQDKLDFRAIKAIFLGYSSQKKGYKYFDPINKKFYISRNIIFQENEPYYKREINEKCSQQLSNEFLFSEPTGRDQHIIQEGNEINPMQDGELEFKIEVEEDSLPNEQVEEISQTNEEQEEDIEVVPLRRSTWENQPSTRLREFLTYKVQYHIQDFITYKNISKNHKAYLTSISKEQEPIFFRDAIENTKWCKSNGRRVKGTCKK